ncbi:hypothetical protein [Spongiibacter tropicus]|uniref:hypothetical protein n=1 Tax=Spongiibacter tropicus TaxID=454602 RepID=UPI00300B8FF4
MTMNWRSTIGFLITAAIAYAIDQAWGWWLLLIVPGLVLFTTAAAVWLSPLSVDTSKLQEALAADWEEPDRLASYMKKHWIAFEYGLYSAKVQDKMMNLGVACLIAAATVYFTIALQILAAVLAGCGVVLFVSGKKANQPFAFLHYASMRGLAGHPELMDEYRLASSAIVAFHELNPGNGMAQSSAEAILGDQLFRKALLTSKY